MGSIGDAVDPVAWGCWPLDRPRPRLLL